MMKGSSLLFLTLVARTTLAFVLPVPQTVSVASRATTHRPPPSLLDRTSSSSRHTNYESRLRAGPSSSEEKSKLPFFLDPGTKGGALFLSLALFVVPIIFYNIILAVSDVDELDLGRWIGVGFTAVATLAWLGTYLFRVATKDMTYAKQLKDYENAVIAKRLEELDEDELQALVDEVDRDEF